MRCSLGKDNHASSRQIAETPVEEHTTRKNKRVKVFASLKIAK